MENNLKKNFIWNSVGSTLNAFISLFLLITVVRINGSHQAGYFTIAYAFANLLQVICTYSGRPFQVTELNKRFTDSNYFWVKIITSFISVLFLFCYIFIKKYSGLKFILFILLFLYRLTDGISDSFYAIMQKKGNLYKVGISLLIKSFLCFLSFLITDFIFKKITLSVLVMILANIFVCFFYDFINAKKDGFNLVKIDYEIVKKIIISGFPVFAFTILIQYLVSAQKYIIDDYLTSKYQTIFGIIIMPATVIVLFSQFIVQPYLNKISELIDKKENDKLNSLLFKINISIFTMGLLSIFAAFLLGIPILNFVYNINLNKNKIDLCIILIGATFFSISYVYSTVLTAFRKTKIQLYIYLFTSICSYIISKVLIKYYCIRGAAYAYLISMIILLILYIIYYLIERNLKDE